MGCAVGELQQNAEHLLVVLGWDRRIFVIDCGTDGDGLGLFRILGEILRVVRILSGGIDSDLERARVTWEQDVGIRDL